MKGLLLLAFLTTVTAVLAQAGDRYYDRSKFKEAEQAYRKRLPESRNPARDFYNLGNAQYQQGHYADAENQFKESLKYPSTPNDAADAWHNLGNSSFKQRNYQSAIEAYQNSLRLRPGDPETRQNLLLAIQLQKKQQEEQEQQQQQQQQGNGQNQPSTSPSEQPSMEEARRFLETAVEPEDQQNARRYKAGEEPRRTLPRGSEKDW